MEVFFYLATVVFIVYIVATLVKFSVPVSISKSHYLWKDAGYPYLFTTVMWTIAISTSMYWVDIAPNALKCVPFLSMTGLLFVGGACAYKETLTDRTHYISAGIWAFFALLYFALQLPISILIGAIIGSIGLLGDEKRNITFWLEIAVVATMLFGLFMTIKL